MANLGFRRRAAESARETQRERGGDRGAETEGGGSPETRRVVRTDHSFDFIVNESSRRGLTNCARVELYGGGGARRGGRGVE